jgi:hypothetical protein
MNFALAHRRVIDELDEQPKTGRALVENPYERELVETDLESWLDDLKTSVVNGTYTPGAVDLCGAPKGGDLIRPAARMALADRVVYTAAVGSCVKYIVRATRWSQRKIDFAPLFHATHPHQRQWLLKPFLGWDEWTGQSLHLFDLAKTQFVVTADIAGFFENISLKRLRYELLRIGSPEAVVDLLRDCLNKWALMDDRGLPQGVLASDILAKLYLESFDKRLRDDGHRHVRYADDIRVFCKSHTEARRALVLVTEMLRERGLTVQSATTRNRCLSRLSTTSSMRILIEWIQRCSGGPGKNSSSGSISRIARSSDICFGDSRRLATQSPLTTAHPAYDPTQTRYPRSCGTSKTLTTRSSKSRSRQL